MGQTQHEVTRLIAAAQAGDRAALDRLFEVVRDDLHAIASGFMRHESPGQTLQATALVNEAYIRLVGQRSGGYHGRAEFFGVAAQAMRRILVDRARARSAAKRGGPEAVRIPLDDAVDCFERSTTDLVSLDEALDDLEQRDPSKRQLVELRFFGGLEMADVAEVMGMSLRTAEREWAVARAWLRTRLEPADGEPRAD